MTNHNIYQAKIAIITGGASGIGAALARQLASAGARVVLADRQLDLAASVAAAVQANGGTAVALELDVRDMRSMTHVVADTLARWGRIDYFFNNAGIGIGGDVAEHEQRDWDDVFDVNIRGVAYGIQAVYPIMVQQRAGHIINTASIAGLIPTPGETVYAASKHAVVGLTKSLRIEAKNYDVRVSALCPGAIRTPILTGGKYGRISGEGVSTETLLKIWERLRPMDADVFARKVLTAVLRNDAIIIVPAWWKLLWYVERLSPSLSSKLMQGVSTRMRTELEAAGLRPRSLQPHGASEGDAVTSASDRPNAHHRVERSGPSVESTR